MTLEKYTFKNGATITVIVLMLAASTGAVPVEEWEKKFGGNYAETFFSVQQTLDNGYILVGSSNSFGAGSYDTWLVKTDANGIEVWNRTYGGKNSDGGYYINKTSDGGYIIVGLTSSYGAGKADLWLIKTGENGIEQWNRTFGGTSNDYGEFVLQTPEGGYIAAGYTNSSGAGGYDAWIIKTNETGIEQWNRTFGGRRDDRVYTIQKTSDGGYVLAGDTNSFGAGSYDAWLIKIDASGIEQWNRTYGGKNTDRTYSVQQTTDKGYILTGYRNLSVNENDVWLIKTDVNGIEQWNRTFDRTSGDYARKVQQISDEGYILAGQTNSLTGSDYDAWLIKTNASGIEQWNMTFGNSCNNWANSVQQISDGSYIIAGRTCTNGTEFSDAWLIKISSEQSVSLDSCTTISFPGYYYLINNILDSSEFACIKITSSDVIFDGKDHTIDGIGTASSYYGIFVHNSSKTLKDVKVRSLKVTDWFGQGINYMNTMGGSIENNIVKGNREGIYVESSNNTIISGNNALNNSNGIYLQLSGNTTIRKNMVDSNTLTGITIDECLSCAGNSISDNSLLWNFQGIFIRNIAPNIIFNNLFNNTINLELYDMNVSSKLNTTLQSGLNIIGGPYLGGNFWAKPDGTGFSQTCADDNNDGICDLSLNLNTWNVDYLPLTPRKPDFIILATPPFQRLIGGGSINYVVSLNSENEFNSSVDLNCSGLPSGASCSFSPGSLVPTASATMIVQAPTTIPTGTYILIITGSGGGKTHSTNVTVFVDNSILPSFTISADKSTYARGDTVQLNINISNPTPITYSSNFVLDIIWPNDAGMNDKNQSFTLLSGMNETRVLKYPIPNNIFVPNGKYKFTASITYDGSKVTSTSPFNITSDIKSKTHSTSDISVVTASLLPSLSLTTDKTVYAPGNTMELGVNVSNPTNNTYSSIFILDIIWPNGAGMNDKTQAFTMLSGMNGTRVLQYQIPNNIFVPNGEYKFTSNMTYDGNTATSTVPFNITRS